MFKKIGICLLVFLSSVLLIFTLYVNDNYKANDQAMMIYKENNKSLIFDSDNEELAFIIYPGGKVDEKAYIQLAKLLNEEGFYSQLVAFPFDIGFFTINKAKEVIDQHPEIKEWVIIGHSLGGVTASEYVYNSPEKIKSLIFLASYPTKNLKNLDISSLYIRGENDQVLNLESYKESQKEKTKDFEEVIIKGGNHSGFADYRQQKGDGKNEIGYKKQQEETVVEILKFINK
ncbi:MAG: alpha/beta fold hydrolase [Lactovum sp.]